MLKNKLHLAILAFFTDFGLSIWSYLKLSNYDQFMKYVNAYNVSPEFILQLYKITLQVIIFTIILFLLFHLVVYFFYYKEKAVAQKYFKFYTLLAGIFSFLMMFLGYPVVGFISAVSYLSIFYTARKLTL